MIRHSNWFESLRKLDIPGDNTTHTIQHVGDTLLWKERGETKYMMKVVFSKKIFFISIKKKRHKATNCTL